MTVWAVHVGEQAPPKDATRLEKLLLTTVPIERAADAEEVLGWLCLRWRIEY